MGELSSELNRVIDDRVTRNLARICELLVWVSNEGCWCGSPRRYHVVCGGTIERRQTQPLQDIAVH